MTNTERLAEALRYYEQALLTAFPYGARGQVFESWNRARKALNAHESSQQAAHDAGESASIEEWEQELSAVMPADFKDWWQNSKREWPAVAAAVIRSQRADRDLGWEMAAKAAPAAEPLTDEQIESIRAQVFSKALQRRDGCDDQTWDHWFARAIERAHGIVASGGEVRHG